MPHWLQLMLDSLGPLLWAAAAFTAPLTLLSFAFGLALGLAVALIRLFGPKPLVALVRFYVWIFRGTPLLVQLFLIFYGLPSAGILLDAFTAALIGFTLNIGAYSSEIVRAATGPRWRERNERSCARPSARSPRASGKRPIPSA